MDEHDTAQRATARESSLNSISTPRIQRAINAVMDGRSVARMSGDEWEQAIEIAGGCEPIVGQRQRGFLDRWNRRTGYAAKTVLVEDRSLRTAIFEGTGPISAPITIEWGRINLGVMTIPRYYLRDVEARNKPAILDQRELSGAQLAGRALIRRLMTDVAASADEHEVKNLIWALGLRHPDGSRFAYAELPVGSLDADSMAWSWIEVEGEDGENEPIAIEGSSFDGRWILRWFLRGGQCRIRLTLDTAHVATFTVKTAKGAIKTARKAG